MTYILCLSCVKCDNITKVYIVKDHLSVCPEYVGHMLLTIQLQSILERWVLSNFIMKILQHTSCLSKSQFPLTFALQITFAVMASVTKVKWSTNLTSGQLMSSFWSNTRIISCFYFESLEL